MVEKFAELWDREPMSNPLFEKLSRQMEFQQKIDFIGFVL